jgi:hypothetical protein
MSKIDTIFFLWNFFSEEISRQGANNSCGNVAKFLKIEIQDYPIRNNENNIMIQSLFEPFQSMLLIKEMQCIGTSIFPIWKMVESTKFFDSCDRH